MPETPPRILIATFGSHGDLFPFIAMGLALQREGFDVVVTTSATHRELIQREGLGFAPMRPDLADVTASLGLDLGGLVREMTTDPRFLLQKITFPNLRDTYDDICAAAQGAVAIVAHSMVFAAHAAAEKLALPLFITVLSPVMHFLPHDPPRRPHYVAAPRGKLALYYNRAMLKLVAQIAYLWAEPLRRFRRELGLPRRAPFAFFLPVARGTYCFALHSPHLVSTDHPIRAVLAGQTFFDRGPPQPPAEVGALEAFLAQGPPPIVFTLGSFVVHDGVAHQRTCIEVAARLRERAIVIAQGNDVARLRENLPEGVFIAPYTSFGELFPRTRAIVHHGGIGTTGHALRAGKPQLVTPFLADQPDNAARLARLGVARVLRGRMATAEQLSLELHALLETPSYAARAQELAASVAREDGAATAARGIAARVRGQ